MNGLPIDHVAIAVPSIEDAAAAFELVSGATCSPVEEIASQGVRVAFIGALELLEPLGPDTTVARFLGRHGSGLHHIAYRVPDLPGALAELADRGVRLIDESPRPGARGHSVAFVHPSSSQGVLVELVQG